MPSAYPHARNPTIGLGAIAIVTALLLVGGAFTSSATASTAPAPFIPSLGSADEFAVLAAETVTNTTTSTVVLGGLGVSPGSAVTNITSANLCGSAVRSIPASSAAQGDVRSAYNQVAAEPATTTGLAELGGRTLTAGVYDGGALTITGSLTLRGDARSVFIIRAASTLVTTASSRVTLTGGMTARNVFWLAGSSATLGVDSTFAGTVIAVTSITANTNAVVQGRLLAMGAAVTLDATSVTRPGSSCPSSSADPPPREEVAPVAITPAAPAPSTTPPPSALAPVTPAPRPETPANAAPAAPAGVTPLPRFAPSLTQQPDEMVPAFARSNPTSFAHWRQASPGLTTCRFVPRADAVRAGMMSRYVNPRLAFTGGDAAPWAQAATLLILSGLLLLFIARRRRNDDVERGATLS